MSNYIWASGSRITNNIVQAQIVGEELEQLQQDNSGRLTAGVVVDAARPSEAPLHPIFEWDDVRAAELFREDQAREVLRSIRVVVQTQDDADDEPRSVHAYVNVIDAVDSDEPQRGYVPIQRVYNEPSLMRQALQTAASELRAFEKRYAEFDAIANAVRKAREEIEAAVTQTV